MLDGLSIPREPQLIPAEQSRYALNNNETRQRYKKVMSAPHKPQLTRREHLHSSLKNDKVRQRYKTPPRSPRPTRREQLYALLNTEESNKRYEEFSIAYSQSPDFRYIYGNALKQAVTARMPGANGLGQQRRRAIREKQEAITEEQRKNYRGRKQK